jgi:hypothetical protein
MTDGCPMVAIAHISVRWANNIIRYKSGTKCTQTNSLALHANP